MKIQKISELDIQKNLKSEFWREIEFIKEMNIKYDYGFLKLNDYMIEKCNWTLDNPYNIERINISNKSNYCSKIIYSLVDTTLDKIINTLNLKELYSILLQLCYIIYTMNQNRYTHNDLHMLNIGILNTKKINIKFFNKIIPTFGRIVKLIDYGSVLNKKFKLGISDMPGLPEKKY
jgi:hypothetical protein